MNDKNPWDEFLNSLGSLDDLPKPEQNQRKQAVDTALMLMANVCAAKGAEELKTLITPNTLAVFNQIIGPLVFALTQNTRLTVKERDLIELVALTTILLYGAALITENRDES